MRFERLAFAAVLLVAVALACPQCAGGACGGRAKGLTGEAVQGSVLFAYDAGGGKWSSFPLPGVVATYLEERVRTQSCYSTIEPLPLVRCPLGYFVIHGREYAWAGYASMEPRENPKRLEVSLSPCFNLPTDSFFKVTSPPEGQEVDAHALGRLYRDFFSGVARSLSR